MAKKKSATTAAAGTEKKRKHDSPLTNEATTAAEEVPGGEKTKQNKQRRQKRKSKQALKDEAEERRLTAMLFGGNGGGADQNMDVNFDDDDQEDTATSSRQRDIDRMAATNTNESDDDEDESPALQFEIDRSGAADDDSGDDSNNNNAIAIQKEQSSDEEQEDSDDDDNDSDQDNKPAWVDEDDDDVKVDLLRTDRLRKLRTDRGEDTKAHPLTGAELNQRLRARYKSTMQNTAQTSWARLDDDDGDEDGNADEDQDDDAAALQSSSQPLLRQGSAASGRLPPNILNVVRCPDANQSDYNQAVVQAVQFHPGSDPNQPLLLTAGLDKTLRFFQVGKDKSKKIHGIHFPKLPIYSAAFLGETGKVVVSGRRSFFYIYDSIAGKLDLVPRISGREEKSLERCVPSPDGKMIAFMGNDGYVILVDVHSKQWIANLKLNGSVRAVTFTPDGEYLLASGSDGDVYRFEIRTRQCVERFSNQDGTISSYLAASSRRHMAVGAESGVVNLYSDDYSRRRTKPAVMDFGVERTPIKSIMNMRTSADMVRFNHDGQILAMSSRREKNSMKLLHVPTATVFSNWPTSKTPLNYVWSMDFSPQSKFLAVGNDKGKCLLYQLQHYNQD